jgi:hypothetical protein
MTPLIHNYSRLAGRTVHWDTTDNKDAYVKNLQNPLAYQRLSELGFLNTQIDYQFNSHGFRTTEFDRPFDAVCFGCSFTMGTGIHSRDTWPEQLATMTGLTVANLGHAGSSNDTAFRFADHYLKLLKPRYAVWLQTDRQRIELIDSVNSISINILSTDRTNPCAGDYFIKGWFGSDENQQLNLRKNTLAFQQMCESLNIKHIILDRTMVPPHPPYPLGHARDLTHPGVDTYKNIAKHVTTLI